MCPRFHFLPPQEWSALGCQHALYSKMICSELLGVWHCHSIRKSKKGCSLLALFYHQDYLKIWIIFLKTTNCIKILFRYWLKDPQKMQDFWYLGDFVSVICIVSCKFKGDIQLTEQERIKKIRIK